ncbi:hypothetical protein JM946_01000 [Steroidobacter sp. S1-65]|uniref:Uncharacterized protein n=1 Tax=Steroidobacter gossypii TaxID=2805490 RepID=A0ABS1WQR1_9GAMM|nr:hypothetical protein [Steroidobacter gossypii]MBM0103295.1 hypothetical protein [Steroidobacter gossypii]
MRTRSSKRILAVTLALLAASQLAGCGSDNDSPRTSTPPGDTGGGGSGGGGNGGGGDGGGGDGGGNNPPVTQASGVFVDAPVAGLSYTTSSNVTGVTDAEGRYNYNVGDTVTFALGNLVIGSVPAQGIVTPMTVANALVANTGNNAATVAENLLMLLQSLDANGDPSDGITFTQEIRNAVAANSIDLTAADTAFEATLSTFVANVSSTAGVTLTPVTRTDARDHFVAQGPAALAGVYVRADENFQPITQKIVTLTLFRNGSYLLGGQHDLNTCNQGAVPGTPVNDLAFSDANGNGVEYGQYTWNGLTNTFAVTSVSVETDGLCGFNIPLEGASNDKTELEVTVDGLVIRDTNGNVAYRFVRHATDSTAFGGAWVQPTALMAGQPFMFTLFPSNEAGTAGRYLMVDASPLDTFYDTSPGIEEACYNVAENGALTVEHNSSVCANAIDTNDTAGLSDTDTLQMIVDENDRLLIVDGEDVTGFARLPQPQPTHEKLAGAWMLQESPDVTDLGAQPNLFLLTVFQDGRFLFGTQENDAGCVPGDYPNPADQEVDANGLEYGTLSLTARPGLVVPQVEMESNGECGLFDANKEFQQAYFIARNAAGDALTVWANDEEDPAGLVFKRVPSVPNEITGAWLWTDEDGAENELAVVAYLPSGVMFEVSTFTDAFGIRRESFTMDGDTMTSHIRGYEYCVDTQNEPSECLVGDEYLEETYVVDGDSIIDDDEPGSSMTRIR